MQFKKKNKKTQKVLFGEAGRLVSEVVAPSTGQGQSQHDAAIMQTFDYLLR